MLSRREDYPAELPEGVLVLTCGIDTQDDRLEYEIVGHGHFDETWGIKKGIIMGRPDDPATWDALDEVLDHRYTYADGVGITISRAFMDEGGHFTQDVRLNCARRVSKKLFCIKGRGEADVPYTSVPTRQKIQQEGRYVGYCWQYALGVDAGKQIIMDNLKVQSPGAKFCHFPRRDDYGDGYFKGLLSEHLIYDPKKKKPWVWEKIPGHERNEALDCRNYALAAFKTLQVNLDERERRLKMARGQVQAETPSAAVQANTPATGKKGRRINGMNVSKVYSEW